MKEGPLDFKFLQDEPQKSADVSYGKFYHSSVVPAIKNILKNSTSPHTIGLFGAWGTGKSTIIEMVKYDKNLDMPVFIFDAWKYQEDTLRRTFLIKLVDFLQNEGIEIKDDILTNLYNSTTNSVTKNNSPSKEKDSFGTYIRDFFKHFALLIILIISSILIILFKTYWKDFSAAVFLDTLFSFIASISALVVLLKPAIEEIVKLAVNSLFNKQIVQTELITKTFQQDRLNSPEQFEEKFIDILLHIDKKIVIVFDNIDRVPGYVAISMLSTIKTFMYTNTKNGPVFLVPCDPAAIEIQVEKYFYGTNKAIKDSFGAAEYLRKIFNLIIWVPDFINTDLDGYTKSLIKETGEIGKLLDDEDLRFVINSAFSRNPREIIQFINNLIAMLISIQETGVKDLVQSNIAYLAKVLIIRQKFPIAYERLKAAWNYPEDITRDTDNNLDLRKFMEKTSRITVEDAEPFIYFKDPVDSRGLKRANDIKNALIAANVTEAIEASSGESIDILIEFISDLIAKYSGQENILYNVVMTQFEVIANLNIEVDSKRYVNELMKTIDIELWPKYESLSLLYIFKTLTHKKINASLRERIVERYIAVLDAESEINSLKLEIISSFKDNPSVLNSKQLSDIKSILESKYWTNEEALAVFSTLDSQDMFVTKVMMINYIDAINFESIPTKLSTISNYEKYISKNDLTQNIIIAISNLLIQDTTVTSRYNDNKASVVMSIAYLTKSFSEELKGASEYLSDIATNIIKCIPYTQQWEERSDQIVALFRIMDYLNDPSKQSAINSINSYFQTFTEIVQFKRPLDLLDDEPTKQLINLILQTILPRLSISVEILQYIYEKASFDDKKVIINDLINRVAIDNYYDIDFIASIGRLPDRKDTINKLLDKASRSSYTYRERYFTFIASKMLKSDIDERKLALEQIGLLVKSSIGAHTEIGYNFLKQLLFIQDTEKRKLATELLIWLREPGRLILPVHQVIFKIVNDYYQLLQSTLKNDYTYLLFSLLTETQDIQIMQVIISTLRDIVQPNYKTHTKDFEDLLARLQNWNNIQTKQEIFNFMSALVGEKQSRAESVYWDSFNRLN